ncbi:hypothetical protein LP416_26015 [Polaromonas sp. P2-4]|nr:hypothetical protein LP416_26015 [Polaromonas sp. P2-4]
MSRIETERAEGDPLSSDMLFLIAFFLAFAFALPDIAWASTKQSNSQALKTTESPSCRTTLQVSGD